MSIYADPQFIAAEMEWRYGTPDTRRGSVRPSQAGRHGLRRAVAARWNHRHARRTAPRVA